MFSRSALNSTKIVLFGMVVAQGIPLLGSLVIARLFAPVQFGGFATWLGVVMTAAILVTGRLETALVIEADGEPRRFAVVAAIVTIFGSVSVLSLLLLGAYFVGSEIVHFSIGLCLLCLPAVLLLAVAQTWQSWAAAEGRYRELSWIRIGQAIGITSAQVSIGILAPSTVGLAIGHVLGLFIGVVVALFLMPIHLPVGHQFGFLKKLRSFWFNHREFPIYSLPADLINTGAGQLPLFFISSNFGLEASGFYALSVRILGGPISMLGTAVLDVFKRSAATTYRELGNCREVYDHTFKLLLGLGLLLAVGVLLFARPFFSLAFGESWEYAGTIAVWLMPMFALRFVASPLSYVFYIAGGQRVDLLWQCSLLVVTLFVFTLKMDFEHSIKAYSGGYACMYCIYLLLSYSLSRGSRP